MSSLARLTTAASAEEALHKPDAKSHDCQPTVQVRSVAAAVVMAAIMKSYASGPGTGSADALRRTGPSREVEADDEDEPEAEGDLDQIATRFASGHSSIQAAAWQDVSKRFSSALRDCCEEEDEDDDSWLRCCMRERRQKWGDWDADTDSTRGSCQEDADEGSEGVVEVTDVPVDLLAWSGVSQSFARAFAACDSDDE